MNSFSLPPTEKREGYELRALALRDFAGVSPQEPLDPFALAQFAKLRVVDFDQIKDLSDESREHLLGAGTNEWSGGACSQPLPNGWRIVILNPAHGVQRNRATLMEEIAHVFLGHKPNRMEIIESDSLSPRDRDGERVRSLAAERKKEKNLSSARVVPHPTPLPKGERAERKIAAR